MSEEFDSNQCLLYFQEALSLLQEYQWVFNFPVTHLLALNVLNEIPSKWKNVLSCMSTEDLNTLPLGVIKVNIITVCTYGIILYYDTVYSIHM